MTHMIYTPPQGLIESDAHVKNAYRNEECLESQRFSINKWYHNRRLGKIIDMLMPGNVLDLGCAEGLFGMALAREGRRTVCVDKYMGFLQYLQSKIRFNRTPSIFALCGDGLALPFKDEIFNNVLLGEILEHQARPGALLSQVRRVLKNNGRVILTTPVRPYYTNRSYFLKEKYRDREIYQNDGHPTKHIFEYTPSEIEILLRQEGLKPLHVEVFGTRLWETRPFCYIAESPFWPLTISIACDQVILRINRIIGSEKLPWRLRASTILAVGVKQD